MSSPYYEHRRGVFTRLSWLAWHRIFSLFIEVARPFPTSTVLDVGVSAEVSANFFEHLYPHPEKLTCVGLEDASYLERLFPGLTFHQLSGTGSLPFADRSFEIVFCNAVLEHVGDANQRRAFVDELHRVSRRGVFIATPNRWFPIELHTALPLLHWLPRHRHRQLLRALGYHFYAEPMNLHLLGLHDLRELVPAARSGRVGIGFGPWRSNLYAHNFPRVKWLGD